MSFLALGDSYTIGEAVSSQESWPAQLAALLENEGVPVGTPEIIAKTGWTTDELAEGIRQAAPTPPYDLVSLLIGVNNQYRGWSQKIYRQEFNALLQQAVGFAGGTPGRVVVLSIPDWSVTPFAAGDPRGRAEIASQVAAFNAIKRSTALSHGAWFVDITPISLQASLDPQLIASDGLHPSGKMYTQWALHVLPVARQALSS